MKHIRTVAYGDHEMYINVREYPPGTKIHVEIPKIVNLSLTKVEAETLFSLLSFVGGDPKKTARGHIDSIAQKLRLLDIDYHPVHKLGEDETFIDKARGTALYLAAPL